MSMFATFSRRLRWDEPDQPYVGLDPVVPRVPFGVGPDLAYLVKELLEARRHHYDISTMWAESPADRFMRLAKTWREQTVHLSSTVESALHPSYQQIIGMGRLALKFILDDLRRGPDHWHWALKAITGADPLEPEDRGDLDRMARAWLRWGQEEGIVT